MQALAQRLAAAEGERDAAEEEAGIAEAELAAAEAELAEVQGVADTLGILEQRYWHSVNALSRESVAASDERQALQHRVCTCYSISLALSSMLFFVAFG